MFAGWVIMPAILAMLDVLRHSSDRAEQARQRQRPKRATLAVCRLCVLLSNRRQGWRGGGAGLPHSQSKVSLPGSRSIERRRPLMMLSTNTHTRQRVSKGDCGSRHGPRRKGPAKSRGLLRSSVSSGRMCPHNGLLY